MSTPPLEELLQSVLSDQEFQSCKQTSTISSTITTAEVHLKDGRILNLVVKSPKEFFRFQKEESFYNVIVPSLRYFQEKEDIDELYFLPESHGGRINLNKDAVLLLENLESQGYKNMTEFFDLGTTRQILKDLASFHAIPLALKLKDPKVFDTKVKRYLGKKLLIDKHAQIAGKVIKTLEEDPDLEPYLEKIKEKFEEFSQDRPIRAPFSTMIHSEWCLKNIMVKRNTEGSTDVKLIDFQHCSYGSLAEDLIFFLYTSVQTEVLKEHDDGLIEFYHSNFVRVLEECRCDPTPFSLEALLKEMKIVAKESQFAHAIYTLYSSLGKMNIKENVLFLIKDFIARDWV